jgi:hypothetical protein
LQDDPTVFKVIAVVSQFPEFGPERVLVVHDAGVVHPEDDLTRGELTRGEDAAAVYLRLGDVHV